MLIARSQTSCYRRTIQVIQVLYLSTASDLIPTATPNISFGILSALSGPLLTTNLDPGFFSTIQRTPAIFLYTWGNLLLFCLWNQCSPSSVAEDRVNKPWRPVPSGLITVESGRRMVIMLVLPVLSFSWVAGVHLETSMFIFLAWLYNDWQGGEANFILRNGIVAAMFAVGSEGSLRIGTGRSAEIRPEAYIWILLIWAVVLTTMHVSDFHDMEGDSIKNRRTVPLVLGERPARISIAIAVLFWSGASVSFWKLHSPFCFIPFPAAILIATRQLCLRGPKADRRTWVIWALWMMCLYALPLIGWVTSATYG